MNSCGHLRGCPGCGRTPRSPLSSKQGAAPSSTATSVQALSGRAQSKSASQFWDSEGQEADCELPAQLYHRGCLLQRDRAARSKHSGRQSGGQGQSLGAAGAAGGSQVFYTGYQGKVCVALITPAAASHPRCARDVRQTVAFTGCDTSSNTSYRLNSPEFGQPQSQSHCSAAAAWRLLKHSRDREGNGSEGWAGTAEGSPGRLRPLRALLPTGSPRAPAAPSRRRRRRPARCRPGAMTSWPVTRRPAAQRRRPEAAGGGVWPAPGRVDAAGAPAPSFLLGLASFRCNSRTDERDPSV